MRPDLPGDLVAMVGSCLAKEAAERPRNAQVLENQLAEMSDSQTPIAMAPASGIDRENRKAIAVLPFRDLSAEQDNEYFCDGVAEEILGALSKARGVRVAAWRSTARMRGQSLTTQEIGQALSVDTLLEGSVRKAGNRLRVSVQQVAAATGEQLWSERYDRENEDIFAIQDDIAQRVVASLGTALSTSATIDSTPTPEFMAYDAYLRGKRFLHQFRHSAHVRACELFEQAAVIDPTYALAQAGLGLASAEIYQWFDHDEAIRQRAIEASERALELRPRLAEAHLARAMTWAVQRQKDDAYREFEAAAELDPGSYETFYFYGRTAFHQGDMEVSVEMFERAIEVGPTEYQAPCIIGTPYQALGRLEDQKRAHALAARVVRRHLEFFPDDDRALSLGAPSLIQLGEIEEGKRWMSRALEINPDDPMNLYTTACSYCALGEPERALECLEKAVSLGGLSRDALENDLDLAPLFDDSRFLNLLDRLEPEAQH